MERTSKRRIVIVMLLILCIVGAYLLRLMQWQLVDGKSFLATAEKTTVRNVSISAPRGQIVDCYGRPLATNKTCYCIQIDLAFLTKSIRNDVLNDLMNACDEYGEDYYDTLPINTEEPFEYIDSDETSLKRLKSLLSDGELPERAETAVENLAKRYSIDTKKFSAEAVRRIAGVRYEMEQRGAGVQNPYIFARDIDIGTVTALKERSGEMPGVDITTEAVRVYRDGSIAPHILGVVGSIYAEEFEKLQKEGYNINDLVGKTGIEKSMESSLRGTAGERRIVQNSLGQVISSTVTKEPVPGATVVLSLDSELQVTAQNMLEKYIGVTVSQAKDENTGEDCNAGALVMTRVDTGEVIAMATYPTYTLEQYTGSYSVLASDQTLPLLNRATQGAYAPGSTFKPLTSIAALETGTITAATQFICHRQYDYNGTISSCTGYHGSLNVIKAIGYSCNCFFFETGRRTGFEAIQKYAALMGFGKSTGLEISETAGKVSERNIIMTAIGQADNMMTPAQLCNYAATLGNGGTRYKMTLLDSIVSYDYSKVIDKIQPQVEAENFCSAENIKTVRQGMWETIQGKLATASKYFTTAGYTVGAKTGTAQIANGSNNGIFISFAPFENTEVAISIVLEHASTGTRGAPLAREMFDAYFAEKSGSDSILPENTLI